MPTAYVTGATGFVGLNLVERLAWEGWTVRALHRSTSDLTYLSRFDVERVPGDVTDRASLDRTLPERVDVVFHVAASVNFWSRRNAEQTRINVDGTRNVVEAALSRGARRFVHVSSVVAFGPRDGDRLREDSPSHAAAHWVNYFRTKYLADRVVEEGVQKGLAASFIHPGYVLGPYEQSHFSEMWRLLRSRRRPFAFPGSGPWCHVQSVVEAMLRAAEVARPGDRFLIGSRHASLAEVASHVARRVGVDPPRPASAPLLRALARVSDWGARLTGKEPQLTPELVHLMTMNVAMDCTKAERELGYRETSIQRMVDDTHAWLMAEGRI